MRLHYSIRSNLVSPLDDRNKTPGSDAPIAACPRFPDPVRQPGGGSGSVPWRNLEVDHELAAVTPRCQLDYAVQEYSRSRPPRRLAPTSSVAEGARSGLGSEASVGMAVPELGLLVTFLSTSLERLELAPELSRVSSGTHLSHGCLRTSRQYRWSVMLKGGIGNRSALRIPPCPLYPVAPSTVSLPTIPLSL